ncbi:MAG: gliding motility-associated C-terminal domain-containing protein [Bacteroidota bacterium]
MKKILFSLLLIITVLPYLYATHNRAGEITFRQLSAYKFEITITTFTYTLSQADRPELEVFWGDNSHSYVPRVDSITLPDYYRMNIYKGEHVFPGPGAYSIVMSDPNRNDNVQNIPGSVEVLFTIKTTLKIDAELGFNDTPVLTYYPIDKAALGKLFIHNPGAYDPNGDSLSYKLSTCLGEYGLEIPGYTLPPASVEIYVDEITGDLIWNTPTELGIYNVAMLIEEWREGVKIGQIVRDMQIEVVESDNNPPDVMANDFYCVEAGTTLTFDVTAVDPDGDGVTLSATGGPFMLQDSPAEFNQVSGNGSVTGTFNWPTVCSQVRQQPYSVIFRAQDNDSEVKLVDLKNVNIYVLGPAPLLDSLEPTNNTIRLYWHPSICTEVTGYDIYRKNSYYGYLHGPCETGVPAYTGYTKVGSVNSHMDTTWLDNNNGAGLPQGYEYCYMVVARFPDFSESFASLEMCTELVKGIPVITNVSIDSTDASFGKVYVAWSKSKEYDSIAAPGPYKYLIYRSNDLWGQNAVLIDSLSSIDDTIYYDSLVNTQDYPVSYKIAFYNDEPGNRFLIGPPMTASSVWLDIEPDDNTLTLYFRKNTPWINETYTIYRYNPYSQTNDSLDITTLEYYKDSMLANGSEYCYKVKSSGGYLLDGFIDPIINWSHRNCGIPKDTVPPCAPHLQVSGDCDQLGNNLTWTNPNNECPPDAIHYNIYYKQSINEEFKFLASTPGNASDTTYFHAPQVTMAGCYMVTAVDSFLNESPYSNKVCIDECTYYELPNIFTPDGDAKNDYFQPGPYKFVLKVDMKIFDRWGVLVFQTEDPDINWDGTYMENGKMVTDGVYYYICDVYEYHLTGIEPRTLVGFIQVVAKNGNYQNE